MLRYDRKVRSAPSGISAQFERNLKFLVCKNKVHNNENYNCIASRNYTDDDMETDICKSYSMVFVFSNIIWYNNSIYAIFR